MSFGAQSDAEPDHVLPVLGRSRRIDETRIGRTVRVDEPCALANGSPALETVSPALVMSADLISDGSQFGCSALISAPMPAMCGDDIDVPE